MNASTFERDHLAQQIYRSFFVSLTLGLAFDLSLKQAGAATLAYTLFTTLWSMFYHSAIRVRLAWLDRILVTPQVHRIHHSRNPEHFNRNFADNLPIFDIVFGTYEAPKTGDFPPTGLSDWTPRSPWAAQVVPIVEVARLMTPKANRGGRRRTRVAS